MTPKRKPAAHLTPAALNDLRHVPGNQRAALITAIDDLQQRPRPHISKKLSLPSDTRELRRLRLGKWRIIYLLLDETPIVVGVRQRPPYDYQDVDRLLAELDK